MGVNFPDVRYIINWGPARNLLDQHQEIGRAGRDGKNSYSLIVYHGQQLSQCEVSIKRFVKTDGCLRVAAYKEFDENIELLKPNHNCCSYCSYLCRCLQINVLPKFLYLNVNILHKLLKDSAYLDQSAIKTRLT